MTLLLEFLGSALTPTLKKGWALYGPETTFRTSIKFSFSQGPVMFQPPIYRHKQPRCLSFILFKDSQKILSLFADDNLFYFRLFKGFSPSRSHMICLLILILLMSWSPHWIILIIESPYFIERPTQDNILISLVSYVKNTRSLGSFVVCLELKKCIPKYLNLICLIKHVMTLNRFPENIKENIMKDCVHKKPSKLPN